MTRIHDTYENNPHAGARNEYAQKHRTFIGQIESVDPANGVMSVRVDAIHDSKQVNLPLWGLSYNGAQSSWCRYMPDAGAFVRVGYGPKNQLEVLNYSVFGEDLNPDGSQRAGSFTPGLGGYAALARFAKNAENGMRGFRTLKSGEFDLRSSGGAGYYFTSGGHATISAGTTSLDLDKNRNEMTGDALMLQVGGDGCQVTLGDVKRILIPGVDSTTSVVPPSPAGASIPKEWRVIVGTDTHLVPPAIPGVFYTEHAGDIRDALGLPVLGSFGAPLRYRKKLYDALGQVDIPTAQLLSIDVDILGNVVVTQGDTAVPGGMKITGGALSPLNTAFFTQTHEAATSMALSAQTTMDVSGLTGLNLNAGGAADQAMVRGDALSLWLTTQLSVQTAFGPSGPAILGLNPGVELSLLGKVK